MNERDAFLPEAVVYSDSLYRRRVSFLVFIGKATRLEGYFCPIER